MRPASPAELTTAVAVAERLNLQQQHDLHNVVGNAVAYATGMTLDQVHLKLRELVFAYADVAKRAEARGHTVDGCAVHRNFLFQVLAATTDTVLGVFR